MACSHCGIRRAQTEPAKSGIRPPPALRVLSQSPIRAFVTPFRAFQISFSVLTVQGIFTEMDVRTFPGPSVDDQIRACSAHRRAQPASLPEGCREYCERDS